MKIPTPINEPVLSYAPGSRERNELKLALKDLSGRQIEVPVVIGGKEIRTGRTVDASGPEEYSFDELVRLVAAAIGRRRLLVHAPPRLALALGAVVGTALRDVVLTRDELEGLQASLLVSADPPRGRDSFREWLERHGSALGRAYVSELARNFRPYAPL